ncbi:MAG: rod shape-determining protein MreC [Pseudomonadota bacterium]
MSKLAGSVSRVATPIKAWWPRIAFIFLISVAFALMLLGRSDALLIERARVAVMDGVAPFLDLLVRPVDTVGDAIASAQEMADLRAENQRLRSQNERLLHWEAAAHRLDAENEALRRLTKMAPDPRMRYVSARVVGDPGGAFVRSVLINAGDREGITRGQAAVTGEGLVGRIAEVGQRSARVLLLTDMNSRIPVVVGGRRYRAVLGGDNTAQPALLYLGPTAEVLPGDRVATSGHGGVFPVGVPVGLVSQVADGTIKVRPFVDWDHMEFLRVLDYELPGILRSLDKTLTGQALAQSSGTADVSTPPRGGESQEP